MKEHADINLDDEIQESCFISALTSDPEELNAFNEAWNPQDPKIRNLLREAIIQELNSMESKKVWTEKQQNETPMNRRKVGCKLVLEHTEPD